MHEEQLIHKIMLLHLLMNDIRFLKAVNKILAIIKHFSCHQNNLF